ncbi:GNAT family N-acetyltransferase [Marmoricola sp. URHB0036]|uniref:GNAT family N-acetyltransferase n=1 Tax=Marmoricola sp. URHB0036 TaxID=1298863 RepID=UPI0003FDF9DD|nr:GNAT family N-acetyltransferase [Marmoricola sp. URHB0036]
MQTLDAVRVDEYDADDAASVEASRQVLNAAHAVDAPFVPTLTPFRRTMNLRHGWDGSPERHLLLRVDDQPVAVVDIELGEWDNRDLAWFDLLVHPAHRSRGYGSRLLTEALDLAKQQRRTKFGGAGWETPATEPFAARHGFHRAAQEICRRQSPREMPPGFVETVCAEAAPYAADYELVRLEGPVPDEMLPMLAELTAAINDAPIDDLDIEDEVFTADRIRDYDHAQVSSGHRLRRIIARHRPTGEPAGHTAVVVDTERPELADQHDTSVVRAHRGHRLGLLLKAEMLRWLAEAEPQVTSIDTWNAESNRQMIAVNERLGYRALGRVVAFQRR